ncbi:hypothetical protein [Roseomonas populi]|uniref:Uncharacterized protein n=1 Tax=Roseomonas populi TaxID=3121582 RepID=A0ABT1XA85_9PROT|nr:hypothetical protein [Roseomonas pecuniae]MCR0985016.1 hypothetical protein [Roseomonas pecuniae]
MRQILVAALFGATLLAFAVPASAEGFDGRGPSAFPAYVSSSDRTPLAGGTTTRGQAAQNLLQSSGVTGGGGQHG